MPVARYLLACCSLLAGMAHPAEILITDMQDIRFGVVPPTIGGLRATATFCVAIEPRGTYYVTGYGDGPAAAFNLQTPGGRQLPYLVLLSDRGRPRGEPLTPGVRVTGLRAKTPRRDGRCRQPPAQLAVEIDAATLSAAAPGDYRGTLRLTVAPE